MKYFLLLCLVPIAAPARAAGIQVVTDAGAPVDQCEIMWHTADSGYSPWDGGDSMSFRHLPRDADVIDILVRADGYATTVQRFEGALLADLHASKAVSIGDEQWSLD